MNSQTDNQSKVTVGIHAGTTLDRNSTTINRWNFNDSNKRRPTNVINQHSENDVLIREKRIQMMPGNSTYAGILSKGKKICIFSDSITRRINMNNFNSELRCDNSNKRSGDAVKRFFPGCTASQLKSYITPHLWEDEPDIVVINVGTNNLTKKRQSPNDTVTEIINVAKKCQKHGVNEVYVAGITCRPGFQEEINVINELLERNAESHNYVYINNNNIQEEHLWDDELHLNGDGIYLLKSNFLKNLNWPAESYYQTTFF